MGLKNFKVFFGFIPHLWDMTNIVKINVGELIVIAT